MLVGAACASGCVLLSVVMHGEVKATFLAAHRARCNCSLTLQPAALLKLRLLEVRTEPKVNYLDILLAAAAAAAVVTVATAAGQHQYTLARHSELLHESRTQWCHVSDLFAHKEYGICGAAKTAHCSSITAHAVLMNALRGAILHSSHLRACGYTSTMRDCSCYSLYQSLTSMLVNSSCSRLMPGATARPPIAGSRAMHSTLHSNRASSQPLSNAPVRSYQLLEYTALQGC
eukprot:8673-Heterococcus_DN1.PRE.2